MTIEATGSDFPKLSTCRWCKKPIILDGPDGRWARPQLAGFGFDPECHQAPNPSDGPTPGHEPGTAVLSPPRDEPAVRVDPATLPPPVIPRIPRIVN